MTDENRKIATKLQAPEPQNARGIEERKKRETKLRAANKDKTSSAHNTHNSLSPGPVPRIADKQSSEIKKKRIFQQASMRCFFG